MSVPPAAPWPTVAAYRYVDGAGPSGFAWEWLRRDPGYQRLADRGPIVVDAPITLVEAAPARSTAQWGCLNRPDPALAWNEAPVLWSADVDPSVLRVVASSSARSNPFDLRSCGVEAIVVRGSGREHVRLGDATSGLRLDVVDGSLLDGSVFLLHDLSDADEPAFVALRRLLHLRRTGHMPLGPIAGGQWKRRHIAALRVHDALATGASIRDVGTMLYGTERVRDEWAGEALKSQCRRLIALARAMAAGGYRSLLRH